MGGSSSSSHSGAPNAAPPGKGGAQATTPKPPGPESSTVQNTAPTESRLSGPGARSIPSTSGSDSSGIKTGKEELDKRKRKVLLGG